MFSWFKRLVVANESFVEIAIANLEFIRQAQKDCQEWKEEWRRVLEGARGFLEAHTVLEGRITILEAELEAHKALKRHSHGKSHEEAKAEFDKTHGLNEPAKD